MATVNRYTQLTPAKFNPMSLQEIMMVPLAKQKQHDILQQQISENGTFDVNSLLADREYVSGETNKMKGTLSSLQDELLKNGVDKNLTRSFLDVKAKRDQFLSSEGIGGKSNAAYKAYMKNYEDVMSNDKINPYRKQLGLNAAMRRYEESGGLAKGASYSGYSGVADVDYNKIALDYASKLDPQTIQRLAYENGFKEIGDKMRIGGTIKTTILTPQEIADVISPMLLSQPDVQNYVREMHSYGIDQTQALGTAINNAAKTYQRNDYYDQRNISNMPASGKGSDDKLDYSNPSFDTFTITPDTKTYNDVFNIDILEGTAASSMSSLSGISKPRLTPFASEKQIADHKVKLQEWADKNNNVDFKDNSSIPQKLKETWQKAGEQLKANGEFDINKSEDRQFLADILKEQRDKYGAGNINVKILNPQTGVVGGFAEGDVSKSKIAFNSRVNNRKYGQDVRFMDGEGNYYRSWKDVIDETGIEADTEIEGIGVASPDNSIGSLLPKGEEKWKDDFVSPYAVRIVNKDGSAKQLFMTRSKGDSSYSKAEKNADKALNRDLSMINRIYGTTTEVVLGNEKLNLSYQPKEMFFERVLSNKIKEAGVDISEFENKDTALRMMIEDYTTNEESVITTPTVKAILAYLQEDNGGGVYSAVNGETENYLTYDKLYKEYLQQYR